MIKDGPTALWAGIFACWLVFLSGLLGTPGVLQYLRLQNLLQMKQAQAEEVKENIQHLEADIELLTNSKVVQHREIRRVLGYSSPDELIFDFSASGR